MRNSEKDNFGSELKPNQIVVLNLLLSGINLTSAAETAGVTRRTIHTWLNDDPEFIATFNAAKMEMLEAGRQRLSNSISAALDVVEQAISDGDLNASLALLRGTGLLNGKAPEALPVSRAQIEFELDRARVQLKSDQEDLCVMSALSKWA